MKNTTHILPRSLRWLAAALAAAPLATALVAGPLPPPPMPYTEPPRPPSNGTGPYIAFLTGVSLKEGSNSATTRVGGRTIRLNEDDNYGFFASMKLGYVFPTGSIVQPAIEGEFFYNGFDRGYSGKINGDTFSDSTNVHSGGALLNGILRFDLGAIKPYVGAGAGYYIARGSEVEADAGGQSFSLGNFDADGLAWQLLTGADFMINDHFGLFAEYKYLNYENAGGFTNDRLTMHVAGVGLRLFW